MLHECFWELSEFQRGFRVFYCRPFDIQMGAFINHVDLMEGGVLAKVYAAYLFFV